MFKNYLKIALRNIERNKVYSFINIVGLSIGMACCILIMLWVIDELSYDRFHKEADCIYRVVAERFFNAKLSRFATIPPNVAPILKKQFPEILQVARFYENKGSQGSWTVRRGNRTWLVMNSVVTDSSFFKIFSFPFIYGNPKTALNHTYSVILTESTSRKYFGDQNPLGQVLTMDDRFDFIVTGVMKDIPSNSHLKFDFIVPIGMFMEVGMTLNNWQAWNFHTYVLLDRKASSEELNTKIANLVSSYSAQEQSRLYLQPLKNIHLNSNLENDMTGHGNIDDVYLFSAIALFILMIACINFMNLSIVLSFKRSKEIGIRKVIGAYRTNLINQHLAEAIILTVVALVVAIVLGELLLPLFNDLSGKKLVLDIPGNNDLLLVLLGITLFTGIVSGSYPAFFLSALQPARILQGGIDPGKKKLTFRRMNVIIQFTLAIVLIISTTIIYQQLNYIRTKNLEFDKDNLLYTWVAGQANVIEKYEVLKNEFLKIPGVVGMTGVSHLPPHIYTVINNINWEGKELENNMMIRFLAVDHDFTDVFNIEVIQGKSFSKNDDVNRTAVLINETAARVMGFDDPIGIKILEPQPATIIGVLKDFHYRSLYDKVDPIIIWIRQNQFSYIIIRIKTINVSYTLEAIEKVRRDILPDLPLEIRFLNDEYDTIYRSERRLGKLTKYSAILAILISCLGLLGLASFMTEQRTKEICIRKVFGASTTGVMLMLSKEFAKWVFWANIIAWPIAYYFMNSWLQNFAYRIHPSYWIFIMAGALIILLALITVSFQAIKAAFAKPVDSLRYE